MRPTIGRRIATGAVVVAAVFGFAACSDDDDTDGSVEDAVEEGADAVEDAVEEGADAVEDAVEEGAEEVTDGDDGG